MHKKVSVLMLIGLVGLGAIGCSTANVATTTAASPSPLRPIAQNKTQSDEKKAPTDVPDKLRVPPDNALLLKTPAKGVQIYVCQPKAGDANKFEWTLKAPEADLINEAGAVIGKHYGGPTWEHKDGSKVVGEVRERADSSKPNAIPLLLLVAKKNEGKGIFSKVKYIQRVNTSGGKAPATGCDRSKQDASTRVEYTTDYYYYAAQ